MPRWPSSLVIGPLSPGPSFLPVPLELPSLMFTETDAAPAFTGLPQGGEDQLQALLLRPEPRDDLGPPALLLEASLDEVGGAYVFAMDGGELDVGQAGLEVLLEGPHRRRIGITEPGHDLFGQAAAGLDVGSVADGLQIGLEKRPDLLGHLVQDVSDMEGRRQAPRSIVLPSCLSHGIPSSRVQGAAGEPGVSRRLISLIFAGWVPHDSDPSGAASL